MKLRSRYSIGLIVSQIAVVVPIVLLVYGRPAIWLWTASAICLLALAFLRFYFYRNFVSKSPKDVDTVHYLRSHNLNWFFLLLTASAAYKTFEEGGNEIIGLGTFLGWVVGDLLIRNASRSTHPKKAVFDKHNNIYYMEEQYRFIPLEKVVEIKVNFSETKLKFKTAKGGRSHIPTIYFTEEGMQEFLADMYHRLPSHLQIQLENNVFQEVEEWRPYLVEEEEEKHGGKEDLFKDF